MLDKIEKYIVIDNEKIYVSQNASGMWKCDKLPGNDTNDIDHKIGIMNKILNKHNTIKEKTTPPKTPPKKEKKPDIKGMV